jgi:energy-coupling factor transport system ATP-binding protein
MPIIVENLCFSYKKGTPFEKEVLHDISLTVEDGEFLAIIGPTQSGKTTLAQHFNALLLPQHGRVMVNDANTKDQDTDLVALRLQVGYVFQNSDYQLFAPTVGEDIAFDPLNQKLPRAVIQERVIEAMKIVDLDPDTFYSRDIYALSGGQKRRAAIAGVLACQPRIMILDDVTAGLDPRGRDEILAVVRSLHTEQNITIILISNSMDEAAELADRIIVIDRGQVVLEGSARAIFSQSALLHSIGLELPETMNLVQKLQNRGLAITSVPLNVDEAIDIITDSFRKGLGAT